MLLVCGSVRLVHGAGAVAHRKTDLLVQLHSVKFRSISCLETASGNDWSTRTMLRYTLPGTPSEVEKMAARPYQVVFPAARVVLLNVVNVLL